MSQKITPKNLTYDNSLPPFLARLRGQQTAHSGPDPILAAHRRPGQKRSASEEAEDAPLVVDEDGNVVSLGAGALGGEGGSDDDEDEDEERPGSSDDKEGRETPAQSQEREKVAGIGASRKRKVGRVVGEELSDGEGVGETKRKKKKKKTQINKKEDDDDARIAQASADVRRLIRQSEDTTGSRHTHEPPPQQKTIKSAKKKAAKKIKLSFGDDDGE